MVDVVDASPEEGVAVLVLPLVDDCFQPGQHGRALSGRERAVVVWVVE